MRGRWRNLGFVALFLFGLLVGGAVWGPRPALPENRAEAVLAIVQGRCAPHVAFGLPINTSQLHPEASDASRLVHPESGLMLRARHVGGGRSCEVDDLGQELSKRDFEVAAALVAGFAQSWINEPYEDVDLTKSVGFSYSRIFRPLDREGRFVMINSAPIEGNRQYSTFIIGAAEFQLLEEG